MIIKRNLTDKEEGYHFECQSIKDGTLAITLIDMSKKVIRSLLGDKYPKVRKGVEDAMGGQILEYEAKTILNKGKAEGRIEGESLLAKLISRLLDDGRNKDVALAAKDEDARKHFYREYGMIE